MDSVMDQDADRASGGGRDLIKRLRDASVNPALSIGLAWNLLDEAAPALSRSREREVELAAEKVQARAIYERVVEDHMTQWSRLQSAERERDEALSRVGELEKRLTRWIKVRKVILTFDGNTKADGFKAAWHELGEAEWALAALSPTRGGGDEGASLVSTDMSAPSAPSVSSEGL